MHTLDAEESRLVGLRQNMQLSKLCNAHYTRLVTKFSFFEKYCFNPYKIHTKRISTRLTVVTLEMWDHDSSFVPGRKVCLHCHARCTTEMEEVIDHSQGGGSQDLGGGASRDLGGGGSQDLENQSLQSEASGDHVWSQEYELTTGMEKVNQSLAALGLSPIKRSQLDNKSRMGEKMTEWSTCVKELLKIDPVKPADEEEGFKEALCTTFRNATNRIQKYQTLTSCPADWSALKIAKEFGCSWTLANDAKNLRSIFGPGSHPGLKVGQRIPDQVSKEVVDFYTAQDVSRELPGRKDCVTVRTGNLKEVKQKRLLLSNLREAFVHFKETSPNVVIGFSSFASLRPRQVVLPGDTPQMVTSPQLTSAIYRKWRNPHSKGPIRLRLFEFVQISDFFSIYITDICQT